MITEDGRDEIFAAVEQRKLMLERQLVTTPPECRAEIVEDIGACRSLLAQVAALDCDQGGALMNAIPNRRRLLLGALTAGAGSTLAAIPAIAAAAAPDPVFGLIEAHKAAWARLLETEDRTDNYEALEEAAGAADAAIDELTATPPTTIAGMRAAIEYLLQLDGHVDYLPTLLRSSLLRSPVLAG